MHDEKQLPEKLKKELEELFGELGDYLGLEDKNPEAALYHYTNFDGLKGILKTRCLWLTNHKYLNDPSEIEHGRQIILKVIKKRLGLDGEVGELFQFGLKQLNYDCYLTSFCKEGDYLPAWRYYGDGGAGFSIGFKKKFFRRKSKCSDNSEALAFHEIRYDSHEYSATIENMLAKTEDKFPNWSTLGRTDLKRAIVERLMACFLPILPQAKHKDYRDEKEWRWCRMFLGHENRGLPEPLPNRHFINLNANTHPPFCKIFHTKIPRIKSEQFDYSDIEKIIIGPRLDVMLAKPAIENILREFLTDDKIEDIVIAPSERPYQ